MLHFADLEKELFKLSLDGSESQSGAGSLTSSLGDDEASHDSLFSSAESVFEEGYSISPSKVTVPPNGLRLSQSDQQFVPLYREKTRHITLKPEFHNELLAETVVKQHYANSDERLAFEITVENGLFYNKQHKLVHGAYLYILMPDNRLFACLDSHQRHHSHLSSGLEVKGAGVLFLLNGKLINVSNESGHYRPTQEEMLPALKWFQRKSKNDDLIFEDHSQQDNTLSMRGIRFYKLQMTHDNKKERLQTLTEEALVEMLFNKFTAYRASLAALQLPSAQEDTLTDNDTDDDEGYQSAGYGKPTVIPIDITTSKLLKDQPLLASLTFLGSRLVDSTKPFSRFGAKLKKMYL